jgi:hypothetical protein
VTRRVLVTGSRDLTDYDLVAGVLDDECVAHGPITVIHGGARGADHLAATWAAANRQRQESWPADWERYGRAAGPIRNRQMLFAAKPDVVHAFPLARSRGTWDCVQAARMLGIPVAVHATRPTDEVG